MALGEWFPPSDSDHLVLRPPATCRCGERASRLMRCRKGRCVVGRCATHGENMERERELHEQACG